MKLKKLFDRLDRIYHSASLTLVRSPLGQLFVERLRLWRSLYPNWAHTIRLEPPETDLAGDFDPSHLGLGLDAFVMWRASSGESREPCLSLAHLRRLGFTFLVGGDLASSRTGYPPPPIRLVLS